jgi:hypothetical protein
MEIVCELWEVEQCWVVQQSSILVTVVQRPPGIEAAVLIAIGDERLFSEDRALGRYVALIAARPTRSCGSIVLDAPCVETSCGSVETIWSCSGLKDS